MGPTFPSVRWSLRKEQKDVRLVVHHLLLGGHHLCLRAALCSHRGHQLLCDTIMQPHLQLPNMWSLELGRVHLQLKRRNLPWRVHDGFRWNKVLYCEERPKQLERCSDALHKRG